MKINNLKFGVSNFRVFDKMSEFEFSPITFLTGPNSSGKSSIMKALNLFSENSLNKPFPNLLSFESKTDLESIQSILNDNTKNLTFTFKISLFEPNDSEITLIYNNGLDIESLFVLNQKKITEFSTLIKTEFKYQNEIVFLIDEFDPSFQSIVNHNNCFIDLFLFKKIIIKHLKKEKKIYEKILKESNEEIEDVLSDSGNYFKVKLEDNKLIDLEIEMNKSISELENQIIKNWIPQENIEDFDEIHLILFNNKTNSLKPILKSVILIFKNILNNNYKFKGFLGKIKNTEIGEYIYNNGATILIDKIEKSLKNSLRINFIPVVKKTNNDRVLNLNDSKNYFDSILKKYYEYKNQSIKTDYNEINSHINHWLSIEKFGIGKEIKFNSWKNFLSVNIVDFSDKETNLMDLGYGVRQIISLILLPLLGEYGEFEDFNTQIKEKITLYLEEPESNLHPHWQSLLTELLHELYVKYGFRFIIETHSEYMIRKAQYLVAKNNKCQENFKIYYFNGPNNANSKEKYYDIKINKDGMLSKDFGPGFVDEASNLTIDLLRISSYN